MKAEAGHTQTGRADINVKSCGLFIPCGSFRTFLKFSYMGKPEGNTYERARTFPPPNFTDLLLQGLLQIPIGEYVLL